MSQWNETHIEAYLLGQLDEAAARSLEEAVASDPALQQELAAQRLLLQGIQLHHRNRLKERFANLEAAQKPGQSQPELTKVRPLFAGWWAVAAAVLILLLAGLWRWGPRQEADPQALFAAFSPHYDSGLTVRGETTSCVEIETAIAPYDAKEYALASQTLRQLLATPVSDSCGVSVAELRLLLGISQLFAGQTDASIRTLRPLGASSTDAKWYLAMSYLHQGNLAATKALLEDWEDTDSFYARQAAALLAKLPE